MLLCVAEYDGWPKDRCGEDILATCRPPWKVTIVTIIWGVLCFCYQIVYILYNAVAHRRLQSLPYGRYRTGHALLTWQVGPPFQCTTQPAYCLPRSVEDSMAYLCMESMTAAILNTLSNQCKDIVCFNRHAYQRAKGFCCLSQRRAGRWVMLMLGVILLSRS